MVDLSVLWSFHYQQHVDGNFGQVVVIVIFYVRALMRSTQITVFRMVFDFASLLTFYGVSLTS